MFNLFRQQRVDISTVITTKKFDKRQPPAALIGSSGTYDPVLFDDSVIVGGKSLRKPRLRKSPAVRKKGSPKKKKGKSPPKKNSPNKKGKKGNTK